MEMPSSKLLKRYLDGKFVCLVCKDKTKNAPRAKKRSRGKLKTKKKYIMHILLGP